MYSSITCICVSETMKFYVALSMVGTDFSLMCTLFPKRTRTELKVTQQLDSILVVPKPNTWSIGLRKYEYIIVFLKSPCYIVQDSDFSVSDFLVINFNCTKKCLVLPKISCLMSIFCVTEEVQEGRPIKQKSD